MKKILLCVVLVIAGCANPPIVKLSPDTYMLTRADRGGIFGNAAKMKAEVIEEAQAFAGQQGKVAIPLSLNEKPLHVGGGFATIEYQFRVVDKNDPEARRTNLVPRPNIVIESNQKSKVDVTTDGGDTYSKLLRLDDLKKRGILSEDEFNEQKRKILQ
jgi:hypothetical protein